ncbi:MAG: RHS repeat-associated core domain-containing protein [Desulfatirhabdiaceae bacterium]
MHEEKIIHQAKVRLISWRPFLSRHHVTVIDSFLTQSIQIMNSIFFLVCAALFTVLIWLMLVPNLHADQISINMNDDHPVVWNIGLSGLMCTGGDCVPRCNGCGYNGYSNYVSWDLSPIGGSVTVSGEWLEQESGGIVAVSPTTGERVEVSVPPLSLNTTLHYDWSGEGCPTAVTLFQGPKNYCWCSIWGCDSCYPAIYISYPDPSVCSSEYRYPFTPEPDQLGPSVDNPGTCFDGGGPGQQVCQGLPKYAVNTSFLTLVLEDIDFTYQSYGHQVELKRVWNMNSNWDGMFGKGWSFAYESLLSVKGFDLDDQVSVQLGSGQVHLYSVASIEAGSPQTIRHTRLSKGVGPELTGYVDPDNGNGHYLLIDKARKRTCRYEFVAQQAEFGDYLYRLVSITDFNGNTISLAYQGEQLKTLSDASGRSITFNYGADGRCAELNTFDGKQASYWYDASGRLVQSTDLAGNTSDYSYDSRNNVISLTAVGKTTTFTYQQTTPPAGTGDIFWHLSMLTDALGNQTHYGFTDTWKIRVTEPGGGTRTYAHYRGRTAMKRDSLGNIIQKTFDGGPLTLPTSIQDERGRTTSFGYDAEGNMTSRHDAGGDTIFTYDANGNLLNKTDPLNNVWQYTYDDNQNLISITSPLGLITQGRRTARGLIDRVTLPDGAVYTYIHDDHGNTISEANPLGQAETYTYDEHGLELTARRDPLGNTSRFEYDANRRLIAITNADGSTRRIGYDCCAAASITDENGNTFSLQHDALLRLTGMSDPLGNQYDFTYDPDGALIQERDPMGHITTHAYDAMHRLIQTRDSLEGTIDWEYHADSTPARLINKRANATTLEYDVWGLLASVIDPLGSSTHNYQRDALGRLQCFSNARGWINALTYDADGRLVSENVNVPVDQTGYFVWSAGGLLASYTDATGQTSFSYDEAGGIVLKAYPDGTNLVMGYDAGGNLNRMIYPGGLEVTYEYDSRNRVSRLFFGGHTVEYQYDPAGNLIAENRSNGVQTSRSYDNANRLKSVTHSKGATVIADLSYVRNAAGFVIRETGVRPFEPVQPITEIIASYDAADAIVKWGDDSYQYDPDGNLTGISSEPEFSANYDIYNRPASITKRGGTTVYHYDILGNRVSAQSDSQIRNFQHDPWGRLLVETDDSGAIINQYIYADDRMIAIRVASGSFYFYHQDKTGNTLALTDALGSVVDAYSYSPYGEAMAQSGTVNNPFTYVGEFGVMDDGDGLFFMKNRTYDAKTGRFLQRDPILFEGGINLYSYADNNPINLIDPDGTSAIGAAIFIGCIGYTVKVGLESWKTVERIFESRRSIPKASSLSESFEQVKDTGRYPETDLCVHSRHEVLKKGSDLNVKSPFRPIIPKYSARPLTGKDVSESPKTDRLEQLKKKIQEQRNAFLGGWSERSIPSFLGW